MGSSGPRSHRWALPGAALPSLAPCCIPWRRTSSSEPQTCAQPSDTPLALALERRVSGGHLFLACKSLEPMASMQRMAPGQSHLHREKQFSCACKPLGLAIAVLGTEWVGQQLSD